MNPMMQKNDEARPELDELLRATEASRGTGCEHRMRDLGVQRPGTIAKQPGRRAVDDGL